MARIMGGVSSVVAFQNYLSFTAKVVGIPTSGTPVQLPSIVVPEGSSLFVRARVENGNRRIFLADSLANVALPANRLTLRSGEGVELRVQNANVVWIDSSGGSNIEVELLVEQ